MTWSRGSWRWLREPSSDPGIRRQINLLTKSLLGADVIVWRKVQLQIQAALDTNEYETGIKVTDEELQAVRLKKDKFHGEWNYVILPHDE